MKKLSYIQDNTELWCDVCDAIKIHVSQPETGEFFSREGHQVDLNTGKLENRYTRIIWAVCKICLKVTDEHSRI